MAKKAKKSKPKAHKAAKKAPKAKAKAKKAPMKHSKPAKHVKAHKTVARSKPRMVEEHREPVPMPTSMSTSAPVMVVPQGAPIPNSQLDRVHLQNISFEIASMRRTLEKMLKQLDEVDRTVAERKEASE